MIRLKLVGEREAVESELDLSIDGVETREGTALRRIDTPCLVRVKGEPSLWVHVVGTPPVREDGKAVFYGVPLRGPSRVVSPVPANSGPG